MTEPREPSAGPPASDADTRRVVYVMPDDLMARPGGDEVSLPRMWQALVRSRLFVIGITAAFTLIALAYAFLATEWYRTEVLLAPTEERSIPSLGALGGLAALAGATIGGGGTTAEAIEALKSRELAGSFIEDNGLLTVFFADDWDPEQQRWRHADPEEWPDVRDAIRFFQERVLSVRENRQTSMVTLIVNWTDPEAAARWADDLVRRLNARMRERALREAETNVAYLQQELGNTSIVTLQESIGRLLETELQKLMLARGNEEFAFRVVDKPQIPKERHWPKRALIVAAGAIFGGFLGVFFVVLRHAFGTSTRVSD